jgi:MFS family permease
MIAESSLSARERRWGLAAAISSIAMFGLVVGEASPLLSLLLERNGTDPALTGLNAAATFLGVMVGPLLVPAGVRVLGVRDFLLIGYALDLAIFPLLKLFDAFAAWLVLRVLLGLIGSSMFTASEAWINLLASGARRGRVIGVYAASLAAGFGIGPLLLSLTGIAGWPPFIAAMTLIALALVPLLSVPERARRFGYQRGAAPWRMVARAPFILFAVAVFGLYEAGLMALLPIWGVRLGFDASRAAATVSAVNVGSIAVQPLLGWLSDKVPRLAVLRLCGAVGLLGAGLVIAAARLGPAVYAVLFVWGGIASGIYPVALGMAGERFQGGELVGINAAIIVAYGLGALVGPTLGGAAMDLWNPNGLPALFALLFGGFLCVAALVRERR